MAALSVPGSQSGVRVLEASRCGSVVAVYKPPGMPFHSMDGKLGLLGTLRADTSLLTDADAAPHLQQQQLAGDAAAEDAAGRLFAVHRLDTPTSGLVLFATSSHTAGLISKAFRERRVHKYYVALSNRKPKKKQGSVIGHMARGRGGTWKLLPKGSSAGSSPQSDDAPSSSSSPAVTRFWSTSLPEVQSGLRLYLLKPETGRTHQLRVAMKSLGAAITGDALYGYSSSSSGSSSDGSSGSSSSSEGSSSGLLPADWRPDRMYLHAAAIRVQLPSGDFFQAVAPPCEGALFQHPAVLQAYGQLLPLSLAEDFGPWLPQLKLLTSSTLA